MPRLALFLSFLLVGLMPVPLQAQYWSRSWSVAPHAAIPLAPARDMPNFRDKTIRQVVRLSDGGDHIRIRLSNELSDGQVRIGAVHVALADADGRIVPETGRTVTFGGRAAFHLQPQAPALSDPVAMALRPFSRIAISIYLPEGAAGGAVHPDGWATGWAVPGNQVEAHMFASAETFHQRILLSGVEVENRKPLRTLVALGDSITSGARTTVDANRRWTDVLADRLQGTMGVANAGISGNRVLHNGSGPNALARFDRDVLAVPGLSHVIVLEGVNDLGAGARGQNPPPEAEDLIAAYRQLIARAHGRGVRVLLGTILPYKGAGYWSEYGEGTRTAVNAWIRTNREADGHVDFARAVEDQADPSRMAARFNSGDWLHPNDAGHAAMAHAVDLKLLQ